MSAICADCGMDTTPSQRGRHNTGRWEHYMVRNRVWKSAGMKEDGGFLCIGCLELRIGRMLKPRDFTDWPIDRPHRWDTPRLAARKAKSHARRRSEIGDDGLPKMLAWNKDDPRKRFR